MAKVVVDRHRSDNGWRCSYGPKRRIASDKGVDWTKQRHDKQLRLLPTETEERLLILNCC